MKYQQDRQRTLFQIRADFGCCFKANAYAIILSHTSLGQFSPSQADIDLTEKLKEAGKVFEVTVLDHIIMTRAMNIIHSQMEALVAFVVVD
jgi:DNA repair protein RadC